MTRHAPRQLFAATAVALSLLLLHVSAARAQRGERRGDNYEERGGERDRGDEDRRYDDQYQQQRQGGDGNNSYTTRRGGTVDTDETTRGDTTTRDTTVDGANGETANHDGTVTHDGDETSYHGNSETSTGRSSDAAAAGVKTDNGFVARGAGVDEHGAGAGGVVKDGDQVDGRSITTNGDTVNRNAVDCTNGNCNRATIDTAAVPYGAAVPYFVPYRSYPCPGGYDMMPSVSGDIVYNCAETPLVTTTVPLTTAVAAAAGTAPVQSARVSSSSVVFYQASPDVAVYVTSYKPQGLYCQDVGGRCYWIPGVAAASPDAVAALQTAAGMAQPTANATVITYAIGGDLVYLTGQPPFAGIYSQPVNSLYAWLPGVTQPTDGQRDEITTTVAVHRDRGASALADLIH